MESFRKAYGALKDSTKVGLAKVNSDFKDLDIAIVKATNHVECPPKERHVRKIFAAVSVHRPRADVAYCIHALSRRLAKTRNWIVAVKSLIVIHRALREGDPSFREELMHYSQRGQLFQVSNFKDDSSSLAWNCSSWVRSYAHFLEERLECFRTLNYDIETDRVTKSVRGISKAQSKTRVLNGEQLLDQLPALQQLLFRLVGCQPEGAACHNFLIQFGLALILKESFKIYCAINDGIINLVDMFFEMPRAEAIRALDIYKNAGRQAEHLAEFYGFCRTLDLARTFHFPILKQAPASFLATMEEYIKEAPETKSMSIKKPEQQETEEESQKPEEQTPKETKKQVEEAKNKGEIVNLIDEEPKPNTKEEIPPPVSAAQPVDLLSLDDAIPNQPVIEDNNALALAIVEPANNPPSTYNTLTEIGTTSGWELALVTTPSNIDKPQVAQTKMVGGFDKLLLDSLYEDDTARKTLQLQSAGHQTSYGYEMPAQNPFDFRQDPFAGSNIVVPPTNMQMGLMSQQDQMTMMQYQQQMMMQYQQQQRQMMMQPQQQNMMTMMAPQYPYTAHYSQQQMMQMGAPASNPFADSLNYPQNVMPPYGNHRLS